MGDYRPSRRGLGKTRRARQGVCPLWLRLLHVHRSTLEMRMVDCHRTRSRSICRTNSLASSSSTAIQISYPTSDEANESVQWFNVPVSQTVIEWDGPASGISRHQRALKHLSARLNAGCFRFQPGTVWQVFAPPSSPPATMNCPEQSAASARMIVATVRGDEHGDCGPAIGFDFAVVLRYRFIEACDDQQIGAL